MINKKAVKKLLDQLVPCHECNNLMTLVESPALNVGDGLGWGCEAFWLCLNNDCRVYKCGWDNIKYNYGKVGSTRQMLLPNEEHQTVMYVGSGEAYTGSIISYEDVDEIPQELIERMETGL